MATFSTKKTLYGSTSLIPTIANRIQEEFQNDGYEVSMDALSSGGYDISITKGGVFKAVLGMKTALKVTLLPQDNNIHFEAGIGIWGSKLSRQSSPCSSSGLYSSLRYGAWWSSPPSMTAPWHLQSKLLLEVLHRLLLHHRSLPLNRGLISSAPTAAPRPTVLLSSVRSAGQGWGKTPFG